MVERLIEGMGGDPNCRQRFQADYVLFIDKNALVNEKEVRDLQTSVSFQWVTECFFHMQWLDPKEHGFLLQKSDV